METKKTNNEAVNDNAKVSEKWMNTATETMMDVYNKQLQFTTKLYDNFFNTVLGSNKGSGERKNVSDIFLNSDLAKWPGSMFNGSERGSTPFLASIDDIYKKMLEYNRNLMSSLQNIKAYQIDWSGVNDGYLKIIETQLEASKKIASSLSETYNKQMDFSIEVNKKLMEEINNQLISLAKQNQKMMTEFLKTQQTSTSGEEKKEKESNPSENKKKWEAPVTN
jgi:hypothetical protein